MTTAALLCLAVAVIALAGAVYLTNRRITVLRRRGGITARIELRSSVDGVIGVLEVDGGTSPEEIAELARLMQLRTANQIRRDEDGDNTGGVTA